MDILNSIMSPLGKEHCMILYYLGIVLFLSATITLFIGLYNLMSKKTRSSGGMIILQSFVTYFSYYLYRIVYSICVKSL